MLSRRFSCLPQRSRERHGVSLIDVTVTMMIVGVLAAAAVPRMTRSLLHYQVDAAAGRVAADLQYVAKYARTRGQAETVTFDAATERYTCTTIEHPNHGSSIYSIDLSEYPYHAAIERVSFGGQASVTFDGFGFPDTDGKVVVNVSDVVRTVTLSSATGEVAVEGGL